MSNFKKDLGNHIRQIRKEKGLTLSDLEKVTGMTNSALSKVERGAVSVSAENLTLICEALEISVDWLLNGVLKAKAFLNQKNHSFTNTEINKGKAVEIYDRLESALRVMHISIYELSNNTDVSFGEIESLRTQHLIPSLDSLITISNFLQISLDWLLKGEGDMFSFKYIYKNEDTPEYTQSKEIFERIEAILDKRNKFLIDLEDDLGISIRVLDSWRDGVGRPNDIDLKRIAEYLDVSPEWLLHGFEGNIDSDTDMSEEKSSFDKLQPEQKIDLVSEYIRLIQDPMKQESNQDNDDPSKGQNLIDIYNKKQEQQSAHMKEERSSYIGSHLSGSEQNLLKSYHQLSARDKKEVEEIINLKLRLSKEYRE